ncbi:MAG: hypothetical protein QNJ97_16705 [Myxococcota bacterium]|nr:hypothetical protein [Myxococcota bacterium]
MNSLKITDGFFLNISVRIVADASLKQRAKWLNTLGDISMIFGAGNAELTTAATARE